MFSTPDYTMPSIDELPADVKSFISRLLEYIQKQDAHVKELEARIKDLEARLAKNSSNSGKPPGSDGFKKPSPKSQREKSGKKAGGQPGHKGSHRPQVPNPDFIVIHTPESCSGCGSDLKGVTGECTSKRQVFDVPQPVLEVTEHQVEKKCCPGCGKVCQATFPENVRGHVQYGKRLQALMAYFSHQHFIPVDRVCQIFEDV